MEVIFTCPHCGEGTLIDEEFVGQSGECRACGKIVTVLHSGETPLTKMITDAPTSMAPRKRFGAIWQICVAVGMLALLFYALLLPDTVSSAMGTRRISSANKLKEIALALHIYHDTYRHFPRPFCVTPHGERTLSWRVAIMPFMEHSPFLDHFHSYEAWNSPTNRELASDYLHPYQGRWHKHRLSPETGYLVITGPGTLFEEHADHGFKDCTDGAANTILVVEVKHSDIEWTEPRDLDIRTMIMQINASDSNGISAPWKDGAQVAMADGSIKFLRKDLLESTLRAMITCAGGEVVEIPE